MPLKDLKELISRSLIDEQMSDESQTELEPKVKTQILNSLVNKFLLSL